MPYALRPHLSWKVAKASNHQQTTLQISSGLREPRCKRQVWGKYAPRRVKLCDNETIFFQHSFKLQRSGDCYDVLCCCKAHTKASKGRKVSRRSPDHRVRCFDMLSPVVAVISGGISQRSSLLYESKALRLVKLCEVARTLQVSLKLALSTARSAYQRLPQKLWHPPLVMACKLSSDWPMCSYSRIHPSRGVQLVSNSVQTGVLLAHQVSRSPWACLSGRFKHAMCSALGTLRAVNRAQHTEHEMSLRLVLIWLPVHV